MEEDLTFIDYVNIYHKDVANEYIAYLNRWNLPKIGDSVRTLRGGFGGGAGVIRKVEEIDDKYITLSGNGFTFLSLVKDWYKDLELIK